MMFKKFILGSLALALGFSLVGCVKNEVPLNKDVLIKREISLKNKSNEYKLKDNKLTTYFYEGGNVPLVGVGELIKSLDGYFIPNYVSSKLDSEAETVTYSYLKDNGSYFIIDAKNDLIKTNNTGFFNFIDAPIGIDYASHFKGVGAYASEPTEVVYDLKPYSFDAIIYENDIILPFNVLNYVILLPNISNIFYNSNSFIFFSTYIENEAEYLDARNKKLEGKKIPDDLVEARNNGLYFLFDYFYGLKDVKNISSFKEYIKAKPNIYNKMISNSGKDFDRAMVEFLMTDLDDPHTSIGFKSFYTNIPYFDDAYNKLDSYDDFGKRTNNLFNKSEMLGNAYNKTFKSYEIVRFEGKTAFIKFDEFLVGTDEEIYDSLGKVKSDAWKYDTFYLFKKAFEEIEKNKNITNVVIDLSNNLGGILSGCINALGFLTDNDIILPSVDTLAKQEIIETYQVDADDDGDFNDNDAYTNYNYYVLASNATFSAANLFTSICNDMGIATIIGEKSGGGMCGVASSSLLDGTSLTFSSNLGLASAKKVNGKYEFSEIENGIEVSHEIAIEKFYDLKYINDLIINDFH